MLEKLANLATIALVLVACAFAATHWKSPSFVADRIGGGEPYKVGEVVKTTVEPGIVFATVSTCPHCVNDLPNMKKLAEIARANNLKVTSVTIENVKTHAEWLAAASITPDRIVPSKESGIDKITGTPTVLILDRNHKVRFAHVGEMSGDAVAEAAALLK